MDRYEFNQVVKEIRATFERTERRIASLEKEQRAEPFLNVWFEILGSLTKGEALDAIQVLLFSESKPREVEEFALRIRKIATERRKKPKAEYVNGERLYECPDCFGQPFISVFTPSQLKDRVTRIYIPFCPGCKSLRRANSDRECGRCEEIASARVNAMTASVRCGKCRNEPQDVLAFDPDTMVKWTYWEMRQRERAAESVIASVGLSGVDPDEEYFASMNAQAEDLERKEMR